MSQFYPNGVGGAAPGDSLDIARPLQMSGNIWYVSSLIGTDAASPAGQNREKPLATVAQAATNSLPYDIIVFLAGHTETLTATQSFNFGVTLIGEGTSNGKPAVSFIKNMAGATHMFDANASQMQFRNIYFPAGMQANTGAKIYASTSDCLIRGCYFECGAVDTGTAIRVASSRPRIEDTTIISTATLRSAQPNMAIHALGGSTISDMVMRNVVVSAGTVGFSNYSAVDLSAALNVSGLDWEGVSLLLGADVKLLSTATGRVNIQLATGGSRVEW